MPISHFIYRCPSCGHHPMRHRKGAAYCDACSRSYAQGKGRGMILVREGAGAPHEVPAWEVARAVDAFAKAPGVTAAVDSGAVDSDVIDSDAIQTKVEFRRALSETPLYRRGALLGFVEQRGPRLTGTLTLEGATLAFRGDDGTEWQSRFLDLRAIQASSSSVQVSPVGGGVITLRFVADSPRRWEDLFKREISSAWRDAGRGEVVEFQPRIRTEFPNGIERAAG